MYSRPHLTLLANMGRESGHTEPEPGSYPDPDSAPDPLTRGPSCRGEPSGPPLAPARWKFRDLVIRDPLSREPGMGITKREGHDRAEQLAMTIEIEELRHSATAQAMPIVSTGMAQMVNSMASCIRR